MRDLLTEPCWEAADLGKPIPDSKHAVSVALPLWEHVVGYEEDDPWVLGAMFCGYPRFVCHPYVVELFAAAEARFAGTGQKCLVFPSERAVRRCLAFVAAKTGAEGKTDALGTGDLHAVTLGAGHVESARNYWRYSGDIISSRQARAVLDKAPPGDGGAVKKVLKQRIAELAGVSEDAVYLFASGMAGVFTVKRMLQRLYPGLKSVQLGFPYVDVLRVQQEFAGGVHFLPGGDEQDLRQLETLLQREQISGVYSEVPSNPLMRTADIAGLSALLRDRQAPLVLDDTIGTSVNVALFPHADVVTTSLTKLFSGVGDVMAGSVILNVASAHYGPLQEAMAAEYEDCLWDEDARVLETNSRDFVERVRRINATAEVLCHYLHEHQQVEKVYYPKTETRGWYDAIKKTDGGYGGLISICLKSAARSAAPFYDALAVSKGPSLGTNYTLACPYTLLAHYEELDWVESCGISRYLIRIAVGLEEPNDLIDRFEKAFAVVD